MELIDTDRAVHLYRALGTAVEMSGGSAANTMCGVASLGGRAAYIGKVSDDDLGDVFGHDMNALGVSFRRGAPEADTPTGPLHHRRHARCAAHDEHLPRRVQPAVVRRPRRAGDRRRRRALHGGLPVRPRRRQEGVPPRRRRRPRRRPQGVADAVGLVLRRPPPRRTSPPSSATRSTSCSATATSCARCTSSTRSTTPSPASATSASWRPSRPARTARTSCRRTTSCRSRPSRSPGCSTRPAPATSTRPGSSTATRATLPLEECGRIGSIAAAEVISHVGPRPLVELRTLLP